MEEVEEANRVAVESSQRVLSLLSQPQDQLQCENIVVETGKAVSKFKRVASLVSNLLGHARFRKQKPVQTHLPRKIFLDNPTVPYGAESSVTPLQLLPRGLLGRPSSEMDAPARMALPLAQKLSGSSFLELDSPARGAFQVSPLAHSITPFQYLQHQNSQRFQLLLQQQQQQQHMNLHSDVFSRSNSSINLKLEGSSCTPTMSSTRSFISSLSMDGSVASLNGSGFHLIGVPQSSDRLGLQPPSKRKCTGRGEDGNGKCTISGRCHCPKRRLVLSIVFCAFTTLKLDNFSLFSPKFAEN